MKKILLSLSGILFIGLIILSKKYQFKAATSSNSTKENTVVASYDKRQDLGTIPMSQGVKKLAFAYKNATDQPLKLSNLYTTCMCTKAKIKLGDKNTVFAGMKGHTAGLMPINPDITLEPGQEMVIDVEFDPNAHGPKGVGPITRSVIIETDGEKLEFMFSGTVTR